VARVSCSLLLDPVKAGEKTDKQFSHYENYYKCSRCGYEMRERKGNTNMMKEGKHELDQDEVDDDGEDGDNGDEVDSRQRRRDLK